MMASSQPSVASTTNTTTISRLELLSLSQRSSMNPFYSLTTPLSSSTSDSNNNNNINNAEPLSPRILYAQSFHRPNSSRSLPTKRFHKNMKEMTGFGTTEEEFEALPIAVRRKVRRNGFCINPYQGSVPGLILVVAAAAVPYANAYTHRSASWKARPRYRVYYGEDFHATSPSPSPSPSFSLSSSSSPSPSPPKQAW